MKKTILLFAGLAMCIGASAQAKAVKHKTDKAFSIPGYALDIQGVNDYSYYEDARGEYVKHGAFKISGSNSYEYVKYRQKNKITETYTASGKYVDGWLDGLLTIKRRLQDNSGSMEWTLTANFKNGLPHGEWKTVYKDAGTSNTYAICHFNEGSMVGGVELDWLKGNNGDFTDEHVKTMKGTLDNERRYHGKWTVSNTRRETEEFEFEHGVLYRYVNRDSEGRVINKDQQDPDLIQKAKELAVKYANGEIDSLGVASQGCKLTKLDDIKADNVLDFLVYGKKVFARSIIGGQKNLPEPDNKYMYLIPKKYTYIEALATVPDDLMKFLTDTWDKQIASIRKSGSYIYDSKNDRTAGATGIINMYGPFRAMWYTDYDHIVDFDLGGTSYIDEHHKLRDDYNPAVKMVDWNGGNLGSYFIKSEQRYYAIGAQKDTMNAYIKRFYDACWGYGLKTVAKKYHRTEPNPNAQTRNDYRYQYYIGYYKKGEVMEGCESFTIYAGREFELMDVKPIPIAWDTVEQQMSMVTTMEEALQKADADVYGTYRKGNPQLKIGKDPEVCKQRISERLQVVGTYNAFAATKKNISGTMNQQLEGALSAKPEYAKLLEAYRSFYQGISYGITDIAQDNQRLAETMQTMIKYDSLANLYNTFYGLLSENEATAKDFKNLRKTLEQYRADLDLPVSPAAINQMKNLIDNMQKMKATLETPDKKALDKSVKSVKEQAEKLRLMIGE